MVYSYQIWWLTYFLKYVTEQLLCVIKAVSHMDIHKSPALEMLVMLRWMQSSHLEHNQDDVKNYQDS